MSHTPADDNAAYERRIAEAHDQIARFEESRRIQRAKDEAAAAVWRESQARAEAIRRGQASGALD
jgi:hypothetical protein